VSAFSALFSPPQGDAPVLLPYGSGLSNTRPLRFCIADGAWSAGIRPRVEVALSTRLIAVTSQLRFGFEHQRDGRSIAFPTIADMDASPLGRDAAWHEVAFLPLAELTTGNLTFTFTATTPTREALVFHLFEATLQAASAGARALPIVELARGNPCDQSCSEYVPDPVLLVKREHVSVTLWDPALPIVGWVADPDAVRAGAAS
jgi:hypothetical protein